MSFSTRSLTRVLELREGRSRRALARVTQDIDEKRALLRGADSVLGAIGEQMKASADARFSEGPRTVAELLESEEHARALRETAARLAGMKREAEGALDALVKSRQKLARQWCREENKLSRAGAYERRTRALLVARRAEADEEEHASPVAAGRRAW